MNKIKVFKISQQREIRQDTDGKNNLLSIRKPFQTNTADKINNYRKQHQQDVDRLPPCIKYKTE